MNWGEFFLLDRVRRVYLYHAFLFLNAKLIKLSAKSRKAGSFRWHTDFTDACADICGSEALRKVFPQISQINAEYSLLNGVRIKRMLKHLGYMRIG